MEKTTSHETAEERAGFEQSIREFQDAQVRIEVADIASRERIALAEIASEERKQFVTLDAIVRLAGDVFDRYFGRSRSVPVRCVLCAGVHPMLAPIDLQETAGRAVRDVAPDSST